MAVASASATGGVDISGSGGGLLHSLSAALAATQARSDEEEGERTSIEGSGGVSVGYFPPPALDTSSSSGMSQTHSGPPPGPMDNWSLLLEGEGGARGASRELRPGLVYGEDYQVWG